jgi:hypothetical protein
LKSASSPSDQPKTSVRSSRPIFEEQHLIMTETVPARPFEDIEALAWLRSQPDGRVTASAAELGRRWGWNRMRAGRRLRAWQKAGHIRRNAGEIMVITSVTPTVTDAVGVTVIPVATVARRSMHSSWRWRLLACRPPSR